MDFHPREAAQQASLAALTTLIRTVPSPLFLVVGDTGSSLSWIYQHLDDACAALAESWTVRLVSHDLARKGYAYCEAHLAYVEFPARAQPVTPSLSAPRPDEEALAAALNRALAPGCSSFPVRAVNSDQRVLWLVPWLVLNGWTDAQRTLWRWPALNAAAVPVCVRFICFVNTDLCPADEFARWTPTITATHTVPCTVRRCRLVDAAPCESLRPVLVQHFNVCHAPVQNARPVGDAVFGLVALHARTQLTDASHVEDCVNAAPLSPALPTAHRVRTPWLIDSDSAAGFTAFPDADAALRAADALQRRHVACAMTVSALPPAFPSSLLRVRTYHPQVAHVGQLLANEICLSPLFVFEWDTETQLVAGPASTEDERRCAPRTAKHALWSWKCDECYSRLCCLHSGPFPADEYGERAAAIMQAYLREAVPERQVFVWSVTDPLEPRTLRCTVCLTYEVHTSAPFLYLGDQSAAAAADPAAACPSAETDPSTMEHSLGVVLNFTRHTGWRLIHQTRHESWCTSETTDSAQNASGVTPHASDEPKQLLRRVRHLLAHQQGVSLEAVTFGPHVCSPANNTPSNGVANGSRRRTHNHLWQAALVAASDCLHVWLGLVVVLRSGHRATVVGFERRPSSASSRDATRRGQHSAAASTRCALQQPAHCAPVTTDNTWEPALPQYIAEMEQDMFPVVQLHAPDAGVAGRALVLPVTDAEVRVPCPTRCFVSARQQRDGLPTGARDCPDARNTASVSWRLPRSPGDDLVTLARLPVQMAYYCDAASLFMAFVLRHGLFHAASHPPHPTAPCPLAAGSAVEPQPALWRRSRRLSRQSRRLQPVSPVPTYASRYGHQRSKWVHIHQWRFLPTRVHRVTVPNARWLNKPWTVRWSAFAPRDPRLRCVLTCLCAARECRRR